MALLSLLHQAQSRAVPQAVPLLSLLQQVPSRAVPQAAPLRAKQQDLATTRNTEKLTASLIAGHSPCRARHTTETPEADLPEVVQLVWVHVEELDRDGEVLDTSGNHTWCRVAVRDMSGSVLLGIPQRCALVLAGYSTKEEFSKKHAAGELNMPLLCHARVSRSVRTKDGLVSCVVSAQRSLTLDSQTLLSFALLAPRCGALQPAAAAGSSD